MVLGTGPKFPTFKASVLPLFYLSNPLKLCLESEEGSGVTSTCRSNAREDWQRQKLRLIKKNNNNPHPRVMPNAAQTTDPEEPERYLPCRTVLRFDASTVDGVSWVQPGELLSTIWCSLSPNSLKSMIKKQNPHNPLSTELQTLQNLYL